VIGSGQVCSPHHLFLLLITVFYSPGIWFLPKQNNYGIWPASGEIDLVESRGNKNLLQNGVNIGTEQMGSTLHFGPYGTLNGYLTSTFARNSKVGAGFDAVFHRYQMEWTEGNA
jgi:beta-glucanase (GH16 family)